MKKGKIFVAGSLGLLAGAANGMFGAGGGLIVVPILKKLGLERKEAHSNAVAVIFPITAVSAVLYLLKGNVELSDALPFLPAGLIGALLGTWVIGRISPLWLKRIFGGFMVYAGVRLLLK